MADFQNSLANLAQFLAQRQVQADLEPNTLSSQMSASSTDPVAATGMGTDPVYGGLFGMIQQAQAMGAGGSGVSPDGTGPLMTRNGVTMVAPALRSLIDIKRQLGLPVLGNVISDYRTREEQARLYALYKAGKGNLAAPPGQSNHETGNAVDISSAFLRANPELVRALLNAGWTNDVPGEPWHWEYGV